jgi:O-acetyl-ADP-ribose deacetylase (regulator of RNase III)
MINYVVGDATKPIGPGPKVIVHCVNDIGAWGSGFVLALDKRWPLAGQQYRKWFQSKVNFALGEVQFVHVEQDLWVANLVGQHRTIRQEPVPVRYEALRAGFKTVASFCEGRNYSVDASVHAPRLGAGLARGHWPTIETLIEKEIAAVGISVTIYDLVK